MIINIFSNCNYFFIQSLVNWASIPRYCIVYRPLASLMSSIPMCACMYILTILYLTAGNTGSYTCVNYHQQKVFFVTQIFLLLHKNIQIEQKLQNQFYHTS